MVSLDVAEKEKQQAPRKNFPSRPINQSDCSFLSPFSRLNLKGP
jgi:hypothetical protein